MSETPRNPATRPPGGGPAWAGDPAELAELFAAGMLNEAEQAELEARLKSGDAAMVQELQRVQVVIDALASAEAIEPPERVRAAVLKGLGTQVRVHEAAAAATDEAVPGRVRAAQEQAKVFVQHAARANWKRSGLPGVYIQKLYSDKASDRLTMLVKCEPGAFIPDHDHAGIEEVVMIEGELKVGDLLLKAGDYFRALAGAEHGELHSPKGCVCMIFSGYGTLTARSRLGMVLGAALHWIRTRLGG